MSDKIPKNFIIANCWIRQCDHYEYIKKDNQCTEHFCDKKRYTCATCGNKKDVKASIIANGTYRGNKTWFCSKDDIFIDYCGQSKPRMPHCVNEHGDNVKSMKNTKNNCMFSDNFIQKHVINNGKIPEDNYGIIAPLY